MPDTPDPKNPTDLLGQPIAPGDYVAWATVGRRKPRMAVAVIDRIRFIRPKRRGSGNEEVAQHLAESYQLYLRTLKSTGRVSYTYKPTGETRWHIHKGDHLEDYEANPSRSQLVRNIVKLNMDDDTMMELLLGGGWAG